MHNRNNNNGQAALEAPERLYLLLKARHIAEARQGAGACVRRPT